MDADFGEIGGVEFGEFSDMVRWLEARQCFKSQVPFRVCYSPFDDEHGLVFDLAASLENCELYLEEGDRFDYEMEYQRIVVRGRHYGVGVVAVGLNYVLLPKPLRRQATRIVAFQQIDPDDTDALAKQVGPLAYEMGPDEAGKFKHRPFSYLDWNPREGARICPPIGS